MNQKIPQHVAIIMDGNGRWAEQRGLPRSEGHRAGYDVVKRMVRACIDRQIPILSVWAFGRDNWARPLSEVDFLMQLLMSALNTELDELHEAGVRWIFTGSRAELPQEMQEAIKSAEAYTQDNQNLILNVVFNYGGKWDILQAAKQMCQDMVAGKLNLADMNEARFATYLSMSELPDPDLFIRTSGEQRISDFFLWQLAYTELYFSDMCWPDFTVEELNHALSCYAERERRYGKTSKQLEDNTHV